MRPIIIPKPSVAAVIAALTAGLPSNGYSGAYVSSKKPGPRTGHTSLPDRFIRVTRAGGGMINLVTDNARILVECWTSADDAEKFANTARAVIAASAGGRYAGGFIRGVNADLDDGPVDFPDPLVTSHDRQQFIIGVLVSTN